MKQITDYFPAFAVAPPAFRLRRGLRLLLLLLVLVLPAQAQQDDIPFYSIKDSAVIVAGRYTTTLARETNSIAVIPGEEITRLADHSALEALQWEVPSAFLAETRVGGFGVGTQGTGMITLRGMGGKPNTGVAVMVDGHPDFMGIFGHPLPDVYGMDDVERVDVLLGPASTVFGGHALGGVINIVSAPVRRNTLRASVEAGTWNTYSASAGISRALGDHGFRLALRHSSSDGHVPQSDFRSTRVQAAWEWHMSDAWQLSLRGRYAPSQYDDPTRTSDPAGLGTYADIRRGMGQLRLENDLGSITGSTQAHFNTGHHEFFDGFVSDDRTVGVSTYQQWRASSTFSIAAGGEFLQYGGEANLDNVEHLMNTTGVYALAMYSPADIVHLRGGIRYQHHSLGFSSVAPTLGVSVTPLAGLRVYASMQSGFRHPTLRELYLFPPSNPDLTEEFSRGYEIGTEYVFAQGSVRIAAFRNDVRDMIALVGNPSPPPPVRFRNAVDADQLGAEASLRYRLTSFLIGQASWSTLDPDGRTAFSPAQQFKYMLHALLGDVRVTLSGQYFEDLFAGDDSTLPMPDAHVLDMTVSWRSPWPVELYLKGRNILDRQYSILPGYAAPGAHVLAGVRYAMD